MDYQQLLLALLPDLLVVVALFAALGVDYSRMRGSRLAKRYEVACQISAAGLMGWACCPWPSATKSPSR